MLSASSSAHLLRSFPRSFPSVTCSASRTLRYGLDYVRPSSVSLLSVRSAGTQHGVGAPEDSIRDRSQGAELVRLLEKTREKLGEGSSTAGKPGTSHFKQTRRKATMNKPSATNPTKQSGNVHKDKKSLKRKRTPRIPALAQAGKARTSNVARKRLKRDVMTLQELIRGVNGESNTGMVPESWKDNWGEDKLAPKPVNNGSIIDSERFLSNVRRIEGLIGHSELDVLEEIEPPTGKTPIATLAHGLDRVLFNPGVHWVQDPRSRVYNFTPFVQSVPDIKDFAFERLSPFVRSSRDTVMRDLAKSKGKRFAGSTSSLTGLLCHIYFLLSQDRMVDVSTLATPFSTAPRMFTPAQRMPTAVVFNHRDGVYMIDSDSTDNDDSQWNILMWMGTMLENFLTLPKGEFNKLLRSVNHESTLEKPEAYRYSQSNYFVMRSQLDCVDSRLPGSGVFDIKTRAALPLRMDNLNFKENSGYLINSLHGSLHSFDREYYDLIRSAFLKYSFQVRIGGMDGIFLAYHNTARIFGFQYIPLEEMDQRLFGDCKFKKGGSNGLDPYQYEAGGKEIGWRVFNKCVAMLEAIATEIAECFPGRSVACLAETRENRGVMKIWVQPVDEQPEVTGEENEIPIVATDSEKPIIQLDVTAHSFLGGQPAVGPDAVFLSRKPWTVHWSISRSSLPEHVIREHLAAAKERKFRPKPYPTGVNAGNLEEFIRSLGFGNPESIPDTKHFVAPDAGIRFYRKISRAGLLEAQRLQSEDEAKGVHVWQQDEVSGPDRRLVSTDNGNHRPTKHERA